MLSLIFTTAGYYRPFAIYPVVADGNKISVDFSPREAVSGFAK